MAPPACRSLLLSSATCRNCCSSLQSRRSFISASRLEQTLQPESPKYVDFPKPPQPDFTSQPPVKGVLPVPRNVFKHRSKTSKTSKEFLEESTREPSSIPVKAEPRTLWKQRMAAMRRNNLKEGISELSQRHVKTEKILSTKSLEKQHENRRLLLSPEAEDERLTKPTVDIALRNYLNGGAAPVKESAESIAERRQKHIGQHALKAQERKDALHTLYMHARDFITTEAQLSKAVEETFSENDDSAEWQKYYNSNIWIAKGEPLGVNRMLRKNTTEAVSSHVTQQRMKRIAESLTGGKI